MFMDKDKTKNLSEQLFTPNKQAKETSVLTRYLPSSQSILKKRTPFPWYRNIRRLQWIWQGIDPVEQELVLSCIASSNHARSNEAYLDTVIGYRSGNWAYEWVQLGVEHQNKAETLTEDEAAEELYIAALCFGIAGYPHLKGDSIAIQSQLLASKAYIEASKLSRHWHKMIKVPYQGRTIDCHLHMPNTDKPLPVVMISAGLDSLQTDLWRFYRDYLAPNEIGMLTVDMPSVGASSHWELSENSSELHQVVLNHLSELPWVDHHRVGLMGLRFGGNAMVRLAFLEPSKVKACVTLGAPIHDVLSSSTKMKAMSRMYLDVLASRIGKGIVDIEALAAEMKAWSLKEQGIISRRTSVPIFSQAIENDPISSKSDSQLVTMFSHGGKTHQVTTKNRYKSYEQAIDYATKWLKEELIG